jgi:hypothetical protein
MPESELTDHANFIHVAVLVTLVLLEYRPACRFRVVGADSLALPELDANMRVPVCINEVSALVVRLDIWTDAKHWLLVVALEVLEIRDVALVDGAVSKSAFES